MFYSASTGGFYSHEIHGDSIPSDAVEISDEVYEQLLNGNASGKRIIADDFGYPVLADYPAPTYEQALAKLNAAYQADVDAYSKAFGTAYLADGTLQDTKQQAIRDQYAARKTQYAADYAALKTQYGV